MAAFDMGSK